MFFNNLKMKIFFFTSNGRNLIANGNGLFTSDLTQLPGSVSVAARLHFLAFLPISPEKIFHISQPFTSAIF